jgi:uncharacterized repeat protein (TIGR03803 family)
MAASGSNYDESVLLNLGNGLGGSAPYGGLVADSHGMLYGTTVVGGTGEIGAVCDGCGTVFTVSPTNMHAVIWNFANQPGDAAEPYDALIVDKSGALYGTTIDGGSLGWGAVFALAPHGSVYTENVLWSFGGPQDGRSPYASLLAPGKGDLYGTTYGGGVAGFGTIFRLTPSGSGYKESILWSFTGGLDGSRPFAALIADKSGVLYGTTSTGGAYGKGVAFKLTQSGPTFTESVLWSFGHKSDGSNPYGGLIIDATGSLYGTTVYGGTRGAGTVFKLAPSGSGYAESLLWSFGGGQDGAEPYAGLTANAAGTLFGTTLAGGSFSQGAVFQISP